MESEDESLKGGAVKHGIAFPESAGGVDVIGKYVPVKSCTRTLLCSFKPY